MALTIGGLEIERFSGPMLECYFRNLDTKVAGNLTALHDIFDGHATPQGRLFVIPLPFFFSRHVLGPKLPVAALFSIDTNIHLSFGSTRDIMLPKADGTYLNSMSPVSTKLVADRIALPSTDLASAFLTSDPQTQLIMQLKGQQVDVKTESNGGRSVLMNFNPPTRRLLSFVTNLHGNTMQRPFVSCSLMLDNVNVLSKGPQAWGDTDGNDDAYFRMISPHLYGGVHGVGNGVHQHSFCLQNNYDVSGPGMFAHIRPLLYPLIKG
jgi:hypothetical protein